MKLAKFVCNLEPKQRRILALHEFWNKMWITGHFRRTLINHKIFGKIYRRPISF